MIKVLYLTHSDMDAECTKCKKKIKRATWIGFGDGINPDNTTEAPYGSCCARQFKVGDIIKEA